MRKMRIGMKIVLVLVLVLLPLTLFSLCHIPAFYVDSIKLTISDVGLDTPYALKRALAQYRGVSLFSFRLATVERELEELALVEQAEARRKLPSTLLVDVTLFSPPALVYAHDEDEVVTAVYVLQGTSLLALDKEDWTLFEGRTLKVEIPQGYASMMAKYGVDGSFQQVMDLVASLEGNTTLITRIKYDNNSSNSFGKMILELSALHAQIWLREPVSSAQVSQAIQMVQEDQKESLSFLSSHILRYDLYKGAMVRRK
ncbi:FtsQ-type POTRA domain-containing protein [Sphaerochaeta sp. PS]|uniref:cell division protein FtsQ/DivIB n=1 Tax=Sphaerochaeta sp. PS TaxID=3076336 RepID=UPI0028A3253A|nr:FtsQ-type POTRA domain-containing protein [Sphaerochaeta sp. PS]MDT4762920.1 FtsQ-type POTRA domain-containing protein [Sphaerochaeta sp. PS]